MSVKDVTGADLALIELATGGKTGAPADVLQKLQARGHVILTAGRPALSPKGKRRAARLKPMEHDLRLMFAPAAAGGGSPLKTVAGPGIRIGGSRPVRFDG
jgi:hypothetical protein